HDMVPEGPASMILLPFWDHARVLRLAVDLALDADDLPGARAWLVAYERLLARSGAVVGQSERCALWARFYHASRGVGDASVQQEQALRHASDPRQPLALLAAHRLLGALATEGGQYDDAARHLDAALALADACQAPYERALTLLAM